MRVGMAVIFQNPGRTRPDVEVYRDDLRLVDLAEPLGFDSVWTVEHHFTDYTMCPDPLQLLAYAAGRTQHAELGSMVVVLPWHDPVRVAESVAALDALSGGRLVLGIGRGLGRIEFEGLRVPMDESRERFVESAQILLRGLEDGYVEYDGAFFRQPRRDIRPAPFRSFKGRTYAAAVSPESMRIMAELGVGILVIPQKPWKTVAADIADYRGIYREVNAEEPPPPTCAGWVFCDPDEGRARELGYRYIGAYYRSVLEHYELAGEHFATTKGYEYYGKMATHIDQYGTDTAAEQFVELQVYGTPKQCVDRIMHIREIVGHDRFVGVFSYAGMSAEEAERNMRLFAAEVRPVLQQVPAPEPASV